MPSGLDKVSTVGHFIVSEAAGGSAFTAGSILLSYGAGDGVSDAPNLRVAQGQTAPGGTWVNLGGTGNGVPNGTILTATPFTDLTSKTVFTLANNTGGSNALPVELTSFTASNTSGGVMLSWITASEKNCSRFEIERINTNTYLDWVIAGSIQASGTSTSENSYSYTDQNYQSGKYQYRLKVIDYDGSFNYSRVVETEVLLPNSVGLTQNYPNPFNPATKISYRIPFDSKVILEVYNLAGELISQLVNQEQSAGYYSIDFSSSLVSKTIPSGVYFYKLTAVEKLTGFSSSVVKKMMLLK